MTTEEFRYAGYIAWAKQTAGGHPHIGRRRGHAAPLPQADGMRGRRVFSSMRRKHR